MTPIFNEYLSMLKSFNIDLSEYKPNSLWIDRLIVKGFDKEGNVQKICRLSVTDDLEYQCKFYDKKPQSSSLMTWEETYNLFASDILKLETESLENIKFFINKYSDSKIIVSTSFGKDSNLTEHLVGKITKNYKLLFNDTTCDTPETYKIVSEKNPIVLKRYDKNGNRMAFYKKVKQAGVPNRMSRWCCATFKEGNANDFFKNSKENFIEFLGMRHDESKKRANYTVEKQDDRFSENVKIILPILKWSELYLWLYTLHNSIDIHPKYKYGYKRVGCNVCCPYANKSQWILDKHYYPKSFQRWQNILTEYFYSSDLNPWLMCTKDEYLMSWNTGTIYRTEPTDEVVQELMLYKGITDREVALQYYNKTCDRCNKKVVKKNEVAMNLKYFGRNTNRIFCKKCLMAEMGWTKEDWDAQVERFKSQGCTLF